MLPNFFIVGAARSGTTSLSSYLGAHPEVFMCEKKEPHFFAFENSDHRFDGPYDQTINEEIIRNIQEYETLFSKYDKQKLVGETSPGYLYLPGSAKNIKSKLPESKIIISLRDPVKRTFSHYRQHVMIGHENLDFATALQREPIRKQNNWRWFYQYKEQSLYYEQVQRFYDLFDPAQIKIILFEDLVKDPEATLNDIAIFLGIDPGFYSDFEFKAKYQSGKPKSVHIDNLMRKNGLIKRFFRIILSTKSKKRLYKFLKRKNYDYSKEEIPKHVERKLLTEYSPDISKLKKLTGINFSEWTYMDSGLE